MTSQNDNNTVRNENYDNINFHYNNDESALKECLQKQIDEMNIINSIYCNPGEFLIDDYSVIADINQYLDEQLKIYNNNKLDYLICLNDNGHKIDIKIELPNFYPLLEIPDITLRSSLFTTNQEKNINQQTRKFMKQLIIDNNTNDTYIYEILTWIQDNIENFKMIDLKMNNEKCKNNDEAEEEEKIDMERLWIYSHHIKNKTKRQSIVKFAKELNLTGFSLPGKPGVICVEGYETDTQEFWKLIRQMKWQRITIKKNEFKTKPKTELNSFRRFKNFREVLFTSATTSEELNLAGASNNDGGSSATIDNNDDDTCDVKMNMSLFMKFLEQHNCRYMTKILFGFE